MNGLQILSDDNQVHGLNIQQFNGHGIEISGGGNNWLAGNYVGTDATGTLDFGNNVHGIVVDNGAASNVIGTNGDGIDDTAERNVISGNQDTGIHFWGIGTSSNVVAGNLIGTDVTGTVALGNLYGVLIVSGSQSNLIGTDGDGLADAAERNLISGNANEGVRISGTGTDSNVVAGNFIGSDASGTLAVGNGGVGIRIFGGAANNIVGTNGDEVADADEGNLIAGNSGHGVEIIGSGTDGNRLAGNLIGTDVHGTAALANGGPTHGNGVVVSGGARFNVIGTNGDGSADEVEANVISGNEEDGIYLGSDGTRENIVAGNYIGTDAGGTSVVANGYVGIMIWGGTQLNRIGTNADGVSDAAERNIISGNTHGIVISQPGSDQNVISGNFIGTDVTGTVALPNLAYGVSIEGTAKSNLIGTNGDGVGDHLERNVISANTLNGVRILGAGTDGNLVSGNYIGTNASGSAALGNLLGIGISGGARLNVIGTNGDGSGDQAERNLISGNAQQGVQLSDTGTQENVVAGNYIGTDVHGVRAVANGTAGILIRNGATQNRIGTNADGLADVHERNVISGNATHGVEISQTGTDQNVVSGNYIGTDASGTLALGNAYIGIKIGGSYNTIGGPGSGAGNLISGNGDSGIFINGWVGAVTGNLVQGNLIGTGASGIRDLGNAAEGIAVASAATDNTIGGTASGAGNIIAFNGAAGVLLADAVAAENLIQHNSIFDNDALGIDLDDDGVTLNDNGDADGFLNAPVLVGAVISDNELTLTGFARPGSEIEFYVADPDPTGFGEGKTYIITLAEGSPQDTDAGIGTYGPGTYGSDTTNRFRFVLPIPAGITTGMPVTTIAELGGFTSEFSGNVTVTVAPSVEAGPAAGANEGSVFTASGYFTDPDSTSWTATVDYGDGSGVQPLALNSNKTFTLSHIYADDGAYTVRVNVTDNPGAVRYRHAAGHREQRDTVVECRPRNQLAGRGRHGHGFGHVQRSRLR